MNEVVFYRIDSDGRPITIRGLQWLSHRTWPEPTVCGLTEERASEIAESSPATPRFYSFTRPTSTEEYEPMSQMSNEQLAKFNVIGATPEMDRRLEPTMQELRVLIADQAKWLETNGGASSRSYLIERAERLRDLVTAYLAKVIAKEGD